jgi:hypothetical protein
MMEDHFVIAHDIPGRIRLTIPALGERKDYKSIENLFSSLKGIITARIQPVIYSMTLEYDAESIHRNVLLKYVSIFFKQIRYDPWDDLIVHVKPTLRRDVFRSVLSGVLLLIAYARKTTGPRPDILDYLATVSTGYTVLSHGTNKLRHPDIIAGIISMFSLGTNNILQVSAITWVVNLLEIIFDMNRAKLSL